jgi:acetyl-CoA acetyltransferase
LPRTESWTVDNFLDAPDLGHPVVQTAENVARQWQISREEQHDVVLMRYGQYQDAVANDRAFQRRYMSLPFEVPDPKFKSVAATIDGDIGVTHTSREALDRLEPLNGSGTVTYASQTHPADGNAALIVANPDKAREISADPSLRIRVRGFGQSRSEPAFMPAAPVPAARIALERAGLALADIDAMKSHNPFVVNDIVFARETGHPVEKMNNFGSSLVFGHPQGPTGTRLIIELIEELVIRGGGVWPLSRMRGRRCRLRGRHRGGGSLRQLVTVRRSQQGAAHDFYALRIAGNQRYIFGADIVFRLRRPGGDRIRQTRSRLRDRQRPQGSASVLCGPRRLSL